ncbi:uncharacterized protein VICG_00259 [Vittaforma corneae ATCC 50505]|uniref:RRM domain-containing protein n=1 Tax=Vittaforma corneae (strain ATCC 50505) TaxID=993615 RepID=L2GQP4_VITCO|nr:uncharacterized protein VICG_00259 [Vittaforma corneae ATCC 50505]ELA42944.1 hypothetical protein VICG_00259 [Vittaforma corneae ATCC 50505]
MNTDQQRNKLTMPLAPTLLAYIKHEYPDLGPIIVSTIEYTVKESKNHYIDVMRALEPLLKDGTKSFVDKLFMFRKKMCKDASNCNRPICLFAHDEDELVGSKKSAAAETSASKKFKIDNSEVIFNKVDESRFSIEELKEYAQKYGVITSVRRLNKGKYLVVFEDPDCARRLVECAGFVLDDPEIKKFFNINVPLDQNKKVDLNQLFQDQKDLLDRLTVSFDSDVLSELKMVTFKIRHHVLSTDKKYCESLASSQKNEEASIDIESSIYYNMFAE